VAITIRREANKGQRPPTWRLFLFTALALAIGALALAWVKGGPVAMREIRVEVAAKGAVTAKGT